MLDSLRRMVTGVALVTTYTPIRGPNVMSAEWAMNVSRNPPLIMVVINKGEATHAMIRESGEFGVSLAADDQGLLVSLAGSFSGYETDKFSSEFVKTYPSKKIRAPMVQGAAMNAECVLRQELDLGDYTAFVGEVVEATHDPNKKPLIYQGGRTWRMQEIERPPILYVTGTHNPKEGLVRVAGRIRPPAPGTVGVSLIGPSGRLDASEQADEWGYYEHAWSVKDLDGGYVVEAEGGGMRASAAIRKREN